MAGAVICYSPERGTGTAGQAGLQTLGRTEAGGSSALALMKGTEAIGVTATAMGGTTQVQIASGSR